MTDERKAQLAAADPSFVPGGNNQGRRRPKGVGRSVVAMGELEFQKASHHPPSSQRPMDRFNEKEAQAAMRELLLGIANPERMKKVIESALGGAERGDAAARNWIGDYVLGKPGEKLEIDVGKNLADMMRRSLEAGAA